MPDLKGVLSAFHHEGCLVGTCCIPFSELFKSLAVSVLSLLIFFLKDGYRLFPPSAKVLQISSLNFIIFIDLFFDGSTGG